LHRQLTCTQSSLDLVHKGIPSVVIVERLIARIPNFQSIADTLNGGVEFGQQFRIRRAQILKKS
jgi:hypothetical protein